MMQVGRLLLEVGLTVFLCLALVVALGRIGRWVEDRRRSPPLAPDDRWPELRRPE